MQQLKRMEKGLHTSRQIVSDIGPENQRLARKDFDIQSLILIIIEQMEISSWSGSLFLSFAQVGDIQTP